jgi:hypothetical protein
MPTLSRDRNMRVFAELHQNGVLMASVDKPLWRHTSMKITNHYRGDLAIPLYPLSKDIEFLRVSGKYATFHSDQPWDGILTSQGTVHYLSSSNRRQVDLELYPGDYASLSMGDLTLLLKIAKPQLKSTFAKFDKRYQGNLSALLWSSATERRVAAFSLFLAICLVGGFVGGLLARPDDRPRRFEDLSTNYILPFVAPDHLINAPESLQFNIDRSKLVHSVVDFYRAYTEMLLGVSVEKSQYLPASAIKLYKDWHRDQELSIQEVTDVRTKADQKTLEENGAALIAFPSVIGETYQAKLLRIIDKLEISHYGKSLALDRRRAVTEGLAKDQPYDYVNYREKRGLDEKVLKQLASIRPWQTLTDEGLMYAEAQRLARLARDFQASTRGSGPAKALLNAANSKSITLDPSLGYTSFDDRFLGIDFDKKMRQLSGKSAQKVGKQVAKEPLIGEIEPQLVKRFIKNQGYELRLCYELGLRRDPQMQGFMDWRWVIDSRGLPTEVLLVQSEIRDRQLASCISEKIERWRFPRPRRGSVEIVHRFTFNPHRL